MFRTTFLSDGFWISFRYGIMAGTGFLLSILFARLAAKETYGLYQYVLSVLSLLSVTALPGLTYASLKSVVAGDSKAVAQGVRIGLLFSLAGSLILVVWGAIKIWFGETLSGWGVMIGAFFLPIFYAPAAWYTYYHGRKMYRSVEIQLSVSALLVFSALTLALWLGYGVLWLLSIYLGLTSLCTWVFYLLAERKYGRQGGGIVHMRFALAVTFQKFVLGAADNIPIILMGSFFGYTATAIFQIASAPIVLLTGYLGALLALRLPGFFQGERMSPERLVAHTVFTGTILCMFLIFFLKFLFLPIYGTAYEEAFRIAWWLVPLAFLLPLKTYLTGFFSAQERNREIIVIYSIANAVAFLFFLVFHTFLSFERLVVFLLYTLNFFLVLPLLFLYIRQKQPKKSP